MMNILQRLLVTFVAFTSSLGFGSVSVTHAATTLDANQYVIFYHSDLLGSPAVVTDHNGNTLWHEHSDPYGRARDRITETRKVLDHDRAGSRKGYTGHLKDEGSNLVYMKARFYDPQIGRFYSNDPIGFSASNPSMFNRYAYANNNPYRYTDPTGMEGQEELEKERAESGSAYYGIKTFWEGVTSFFSSDNSDSGTWSEGHSIGSTGGDVLTTLGAFALLKGVKKGAAFLRKPTTVYQALDENGKVEYVGITSDLKSRAKAHAKLGRNIQAIAGLENISRSDARAVEQVLIERYALKSNDGTLSNIINSISRHNPSYNDAIARGTELLKQAGH